MLDSMHVGDFKMYHDGNRLKKIHVKSEMPVEFSDHTPSL